MNEQQQPRSNNTCLEAGQLTAWRDGAMPLREADEVTAHLAGCARCAAEERALVEISHQSTFFSSTASTSCQVSRNFISLSKRHCSIAPCSQLACFQASIITPRLLLFVHGSFSESSARLVPVQCR